MRAKHYLGSICALLSGLLYGFVGYFGVSAIKTLASPANMLFWRFLISSLVMTSLVLFQKSKSTLPRGQLFIAFLGGAAFYSFSTLLYFVACPYIGSGLAMVVLYTYPAMIIFINHFVYGSHIPRIYYFAIVLISGGLLFFIDFHEMHFDLWGIFLSIASAFLYAIYIFTSKKISSLPPLTSTLMVSLGCMTTSLFVAILQQSFSIPHGSNTWFNLFGIGVLSSAVAILLLQYSLNFISSERASILSVLEPIFVLILGVTLLGEPMKLQYGIGVIIVLTGAILVLFTQHEKKEKVGR